MTAFKNYNTIHLRLNQVEMLEFVMLIIFIVNDVFNKTCVSNKTEDLNLSMLNIIAGINESKALTRHASCQCKCKLDGRKCNSNQKQNNNKY